MTDEHDSLGAWVKTLNKRCGHPEHDGFTDGYRVDMKQRDCDVCLTLAITMCMQKAYDEGLADGAKP
jgi:hypothetical protein